MRILLTNDDGISSEGLLCLRDGLGKKHEVWVAAPDKESAASHGVTLRAGVTFNKLDDRFYSCSGTPADCVLYSILGSLPFVPDLVVSGINRGPNLGTDIIYSGTVAAARQAALMGCPGLAVSLSGHGEGLDFKPSAAFVSENVKELADMWNQDNFININIPAELQYPAAVHISHPSRRVYEDKLVIRSESGNSKTFALEGALNYAKTEEGSDWAAVESGVISISPINLHPLNQSGNEAYHSIKFTGPVRPGQAG